MIAYVDKPPRVERRGDGFLVTVTSGDTETSFMLTLHAMQMFCGCGMVKVKEAQAALAAPVQFPKRGRTKPC